MRAVAALGLSLLVLTPTPAAAPPRPVDPLPPAALVRLGHARLVCGYPINLIVSPDSRYAVSHRNWCDLVEGGDVPPPVHIPDGYVIIRYFRGGGYAVEGENDSLIFDPGAKRPRARVGSAGARFDSVGRYAVHLEERGNKMALLLGDLRLPDEGRAWQTIAPLDTKPGSLHLSDDGGHVLWKDDVNDRVRVYSIATKTTVQLAVRAADAPRWSTLSPDGKLAATACDRAVLFHDTASGKLVRRAEVPANGDREGGFTPDGKLVVLPSRSTGLVIVPVDAATPAYQLAIRGGKTQHVHALMPDSRHIALADSNGVIRVHDLRTGRQTDPHSRFPCFDGVQLLDAHTAVSWTPHGQVVRWDIRTGRVLAEATVPLPADQDRCHHMAFSHDGRHAAVSLGSRDEKDSQLCLIADLAAGKILARQAGTGYSPIRAAFHPSGNAVAVLNNYDGGNKVNFTLFDVPSGRHRWVRQQGYGVLTFSRDGRTMLHAYQYGSSLIEEATGKPRWSTSLPLLERNRDNSARLVAMDPKGRRAVVVRDRDASVLDGLTGQPLMHLWLGDTSEEGRIAAVSGDARYLATVHYGSDFRLFDLSAKVYAVPIVSRWLAVREVSGLALNADGSRLVTAHTNGTCFVWDVKKLTEKEEDPAPHVPEWERLASLDAEQAQPAILALTRGGAVALFAKKLTPAAEVAPKRIAAWIAELDSDDFARRAAAEEALTKAHDQAEEALKRVLLKPASLEQARRAERLLKRIENRENDAERLRQMRAVEILERVGSKEAVALLKKLAAGAPAASLTREAAASLRRLQG